MATRNTLLKQGTKHTKDILIIGDRNAKFESNLVSGIMGTLSLNVLYGKQTANREDGLHKI